MSTPCFRPLAFIASCVFGTASWVALAALSGLVPATASAASARLNDTAITHCIDINGEFIDCAGTGQDAEVGRDVTRSRDSDGLLGFRFTRLCNSGQRAGEGHCPASPTPGDAPNEWGCTRDDVTKLLWETKTASGRRGGSTGYTFYTAKYDPVGEFGGPNDVTGYVKGVNAKGLCGLNDWRLPTPSELMGIAAMGVTDGPAIDLRFMPNTADSFYWAAGTVRDEFFAKQLGWGADFAFGLGDISGQFRDGARSVRLVHGGATKGRRFVISGDQQEVADRATGLTWRRCVEGESVSGDACTGAALEVSWMDALARAQQQAHDTGVAWRLPNVKELSSLLDNSGLPHIDVKAFPGGDGFVLWTSSSFPTDPTPRCVDFDAGGTGSCSQGSDTQALRLVRDSD
jgi:hypothetical protein